jgi:hypothetical protein
MRVSVLVAMTLTVLVGCSATAGSPRSADTSPFSTPDEGIRAVRMNTGEALAYVQPETASQILCQILDKDRWERLLDDHVSRAPSGAPDPSCMIAGERAGLDLRLTRLDASFRPTTSIAGRPTALIPGGDAVEYRVALVDTAPPPPAVPLLDLSVPYGRGLDPPAQRELAVRILVEIVPMLAREGDQLPAIDPAGDVTFADTPLLRGAQIVDLPRPIQALQLCTLGQQLLHVPPAHVASSARCDLSTPDGPVTLALQPTTSAPSYPDRLAGRPAHSSTTAAPTVLVRLRDDAQVDLAITARNPATLAEQLVPALLG